MRARPRRLIPLLACLLAVAIAGCGDSSEAPSRPAPAATEFPAAEGKTIEDLLRDSGAEPTKLVVAPAAKVFDVGPNRFPFGVFTLAQEQIEDADVALYFAKNGKSPVKGPFPARVTSLQTKPAYRSRSQGAGEATTAYVVPAVEFDRPGPWMGIAMLKGEDGLEVTRFESTVVGGFGGVPEIGEKAPVIHTPTAADVGGDLEKIDTRVPPSQMHAVDFADVVGRKPVVLVFATPALCQSRVCGPVVDIAQQVADANAGEVEFIHMEVYNDNEIPKGIRPQLRAFGLPTEPWTFAIDRRGIIRDRLEGAYGVEELERSVRKIAPAG